VDNYTATNNPAIFNDFPTIPEICGTYISWFQDSANDRNGKYICNAVALVLQEYNKSADPNGIVPFQVYTDLAWEDYKKLSLKKKHPLVAWNTTIVGRYNSESVNFSVNEQIPVESTM
jgi:hypothetical protein